MATIHSGLSKILITTAMLVSGISWAAKDGAPNKLTPDYAFSAETIYGFKAKTDALEFVVTSSGCIKAKDFSLLVSKWGAEDYTVTLIRNNPDHCKAMPRLVTIQKTLNIAITSATRFQLGNPVAVKRSEN